MMFSQHVEGLYISKIYGFWPHGSYRLCWILLHCKPTLQVGIVGRFALTARLEHAKAVNATASW